jgi:hypothetical protein
MTRQSIPFKKMLFLKIDGYAAPGYAKASPGLCGVGPPKL